MVIGSWFQEFDTGIMLWQRKEHYVYLSGDTKGVGNLCFPSPCRSKNKNLVRISQGKGIWYILRIPKFPKGFCYWHCLNSSCSHQVTKWTITGQGEQTKKTIRIPPRSSSRAVLPVVIFTTDFLWNKKIVNLKILVCDQQALRALNFDWTDFAESLCSSDVTKVLSGKMG